MAADYVHGADRLGPLAAGSLVTIGNFDGVHLGHVALLQRVAAEAAHARLTPLVLTFDPHPAAVLGRDAPPVLTPMARKLELLQRTSSELRVVVEPFTKTLAACSPETFAEALLVRALSARRVVVGENFRFGARRAGDLERLKQLGRALGFEAEAAPLERVGGESVSSSRIRRALLAGELTLANRLLGRPHALTGTVIRGEQFARQLGVPSANLDAPAEMMPRAGVYAVLVDLERPTATASTKDAGRPGEISRHGRTFHRLGTGVANVGTRPTAGGGPLRAEVHIHDLDRDLYGQTLRVKLIARLRDERRFEDLDSLRAQLADDVERSRSLTANTQACGELLAEAPTGPKSAAP